MSKYKCGVKGFVPGRVWFWFGTTKLTEASSFVFYDSAHPAYLGTLCVRTNVAEICVVMLN